MRAALPYDYATLDELQSFRDGMVLRLRCEIAARSGTVRVFGNVQQWLAIS